MKINKTTVVVPNYNGRQYLDICLQALLAQIGPEQIIVVDNGSEDGSKDLLYMAYPGVRVIALGQNYGFCRAVNEGIRAAETDYVILLNNDTEVFPGFVEALEKALDRDAKAFSAGAKMIQYHDQSKLDDAGNFYCALGWAFARGKDRSADLYEKRTRVFASCGGAAIYRRSVFETLGYFDEEHFAYLEDIDVGYRAQIYGWHNLYIPEAKVYHVGSASSGSRYNEFKVRYSSRNSIYLVYKNMPLGQIILNFPFLAAGFAVKFLFFVRKGLGKTYFRGLIAGLKLCKKEKKVRFTPAHLGAYLKIQVQLYVNLIRRFR